MRLVNKGFFVSVLALLGFVWATPADAIPAFGSKHDKKCSYCHNAFPQLNKKGRAFKERGYRLSYEEVGGLLEQGEFPISVVLKARPYDKNTSGGTAGGQGKRRNRALHEIEIIVAGTIAENFSGFFEIEMEDDKMGDNATAFDPIIGPATLHYNFNQALNLQFVWGPAFWADPYGGLLVAHNRLTRNTNQIISGSWGGADGGGSLNTFRQNVILTGRPIGWLFYSIGYAGVADDGVGNDANTITGRLAVDVLDAVKVGEAFGLPVDLMVGGFVIDGENKSGISDDLDFTRLGVDVQADIGNFRFNAAYINTDDDLNEIAGTEADNWGYSLKGYYVFQYEDKAPWIVPLVRFDRYSASNRSDHRSRLTFNLSYYLTQNARAFFEYFQETDRNAPGNRHYANRYTLQLDVAF